MPSKEDYDVTARIALAGQLMQTISGSVLCKWFRHAVLPLNPEPELGSLRTKHEVLRRVWLPVCAEIRPSQILPGVCTQ